MQKWRAIAASLVCFVAASCLSCAEEVAPEEYLHNEPADRFGLITVTYNEHRIPGGVEPQVLVNAFFARHVALSHEQVLDIVNHPDTLEPSISAVPVGQCRIKTRDLREQALTHDSAYLDLLDAGDIRISTEEQALALRRRSFPDIFPMVTGLTYEGILSDTRRLRHGTSLLLEGRGSQEVGDFVVSLKAPSVPRLLEVASQPVTGSYSSFDWTTDLEIKWLCLGEAGNVLVELVAIDFDRSVSLQCRLPDTGVGHITNTALELMKGRVAPDSTLRLIVRRVARSRFQTPGIHFGEVTYVSRDSVLLE